MADFPTSPHSFTPFANGALSDAAQVTDIYAEVEAIEEREGLSQAVGDTRRVHAGLEIGDGNVTQTC